GQGGLPGSRKTKKDRRIPLFPNIDRTMHGERILVDRKNEIKRRKNSLLNFAGISRPPDQDYFFCEIQNSKIMLSSSILFGIRHKPRGIYNRPFRFKIYQFGCR